ncbi:MAG TPA: DUF308 domain-containing protein [Longimicrobium sp.]
MIADDLKSAYRQSMWMLVLRGLFGVALGVFILMRPVESVAVFALVVAFWALFDGFANIMRAFSVRGAAPHWWVLLLSGGISVAFGVTALYDYPALSLSFAVLWTAVWLFTAGAMGIYAALQERRARLPWTWTMVLGVLTVAAGVLAFAYPGITLAWLLGLLAAYGIISGAAMLLGAWKLHSIGRDVDRIVGTPIRA